LANDDHKKPAFIWVSIAIAISFWFLDSLMDTLIFDPQPFYIELFPLHEPKELWMRLIAVCLTISFGVYANSISKKQVSIDKQLRSEILERKKSEELLRKSEQSLHDFYAITADPDLSFDARVDRLLTLGCERFGTDIGILANISGNDYRVNNVVSPDNAIKKHTVFPLGDTYCQITIKAGAPVFYKRVVKTSLETHPAYLKFRLETYIGTRVVTGDILYGTLNFSSPNEREENFSQADLDFLQLMGEWIGNELQRQQSDKKHKQAVSVFNNTNDGILITDKNREIIAINKAFTSITGYMEEDAIGQNPRFLQSGHHDPEFYKKLWAEINSTGHWQGEIWNRRKDGELIPVWQNISVVKDKEGNIENYTSVFSDISAIKKYEERLQHAAHHDALTGLANRVLFDIHLDHTIQKSKRNSGCFALLFLDMDGFKEVNDSLGHSAGDHLLQQIAVRIKNCIRDEDTAARFGGDEFTVIIEEIKQATDAELVAAKIINAISEPISVRENAVNVSTSVGISIYPDDANDANELMYAADSAMFRAKNRGKNNYRLFSRMKDEKSSTEKTIKKEVGR